MYQAYKAYKKFLMLAIITFLFISLGNINMTIGNTLNKYLWEKRIVLIFSKDKDISLYKEQKNQFSNLQDETNERDLVFIEIFKDKNTKHESLQDKFNPNSSNFKIILIGKDGGIKLNSSTVVTHEKIFSLIDSMPMRQMEMLQ